MIVCIAHAKVGYRQALHRNPGLERVPGFFIGGRCPEPACNARAAGQGEMRESHPNGGERGRLPPAQSARVYADWVEENVLEPVAHRQYVFTVPRLLRYRSKMPASAAEATGGRGSWPRSRRR